MHTARFAHRFRFLRNPEYVRVGDRLLFREGRTKGVGKITRLIPLGSEEESTRGPPAASARSRTQSASAGNAAGAAAAPAAPSAENSSGKTPTSVVAAAPTAAEATAETKA